METQILPTDSEPTQGVTHEPPNIFTIVEMMLASELMAGIPGDSAGLSQSQSQWQGMNHEPPRYSWRQEMNYEPHRYSWRQRQPQSVRASGKKWTMNFTGFPGGKKWTMNITGIPGGKEWTMNLTSIPGGKKWTMNFTGIPGNSAGLSQSQWQGMKHEPHRYAWRQEMNHEPHRYSWRQEMNHEPHRYSWRQRRPQSEPVARNEPWTWHVFTKVETVLALVKASGKEWTINLTCTHKSGDGIGFSQSQWQGMNHKPDMYSQKWRQYWL